MQLAATLINATLEHNSQGNAVQFFSLLHKRSPFESDQLPQVVQTTADLILEGDFAGTGPAIVTQGLQDQTAAP